MSLSVRALYPNPRIVSQDLEGLCINSVPRGTEAWARPHTGTPRGQNQCPRRGTVTPVNEDSPWRPLRPGLVWKREDARGAGILPTDWGQTLLPHEPKGPYVGRVQNPDNRSQDSQHPEVWVCITDLFWFRKINFLPFECHRAIHIVLVPLQFFLYCSSDGLLKWMLSVQTGTSNPHQPTQLFPSLRIRSNLYTSVTWVFSCLICMWPIFPNQPSESS